MANFPDKSPLNGYNHLRGLFPGAYTPKRFAFMVAAAFLFFGLLINSSWNATPDSALYLSLGESIANGEGYRFNGEPHTMAFPGYPLMLAGVVRTLGSDFLSYRIFMALSGFITALIGFAFLKRLGGKDLAMVVGSIFVACHTLILNSSMTLSDVPFALFSLISLTMVLAAGEKKSMGWIMAAAFISSIPPIIRINGLGIPPVEAFFLFFALKRVAAAKTILALSLFLAIAFAPAIGWQVWKSSFPVSQAEGEYLNNVLGRTIEAHLWVALDALAALGPTVAEAITGANIKTGFLEHLILLITIVGMIRLWRWGDRLLTPLILVQFGGLLVTAPGARYVLFMIPALIIMFLLGLELIRESLVSSWGLNLSSKRLLWGVAIILLITNLGANFPTWYQCRFPLDPYGAQTERSDPYFAAARWLRENDPNSVIMTTRSRIIHYLSGCRTIALLRSGYPEQHMWIDEQEKFRELYKRTRPDYLFTDRKNMELYNSAIEALRSSSARIKEVKEATVGARFRLYRIIWPME